jgi:hypothetical protein
VQPSPRVCPDDAALLVGLAGSETSLFRCPNCLRTFRANANGGLDRTEPVPVGSMLMDRTVYSRTLEALQGAASTVASSTEAQLARLIHVEANLDALLKASATSAVKPADLERARDDARLAIEAAQGAQAGTRQLQSDVRSLEQTIDELNLTTLRARLAELERLLDRHIGNHGKESGG